MHRLIFIGDIVGEAGLALLEAQLPRLVAHHRPTFLVANGENQALNGPNPAAGCGMDPQGMQRLLDLGVDLVTGGNHSWDGPHAAEMLAQQPRLLRPLNTSREAPGRGAAILEKEGLRLGVVNLIGRSAMPPADAPLDALELQLAAWHGQVDAVLVDFHGESVSEKQIVAFAFAGRVTAFLGTHTHVATLDTRLLPGGTAYVSDVGMTGPSGGMQGYAPEIFVRGMRQRLPQRTASGFAEGPAELGAVLVDFEDGRAQRIERLHLLPDASQPGAGALEG